MGDFGGPSSPSLASRRPVSRLDDAVSRLLQLLQMVQNTRSTIADAPGRAGNAVRGIPGALEGWLTAPIGLGDPQAGSGMGGDLLPGPMGGGFTGASLSSQPPSVLGAIQPGAAMGGDPMSSLNAPPPALGGMAAQSSPPPAPSLGSSPFGSFNPRGDVGALSALPTAPPPPGGSLPPGGPGGGYGVGPPGIQGENMYQQPDLALGGALSRAGYDPATNMLAQTVMQRYGGRHLQDLYQMWSALAGMDPSGYEQMPTFLTQFMAGQIDPRAVTTGVLEKAQSDPQTRILLENMGPDAFGGLTNATNRQGPRIAAARAEYLRRQIAQQGQDALYNNPQALDSQKWIDIANRVRTTGR